MSRICRPTLLGAALVLSLVSAAFAHGVAAQDKGFLTSASGVHIGPFIYLGAKHMVTGYDHLLYLSGVIFFLGRLRDVVIFVSLFAVGHSITLLFGVFSGLYVNAHLIDAIIGLSVCYKALENLQVIGFFSPKSAVFGFGLVHGLGLSSKLRDLSLSSDGLIINMLAFNIGVEIGQVVALTGLFGGLAWLRQRPDYPSVATNTNVLLFAAGLVLFALQLVGYVTL